MPRLLLVDDNPSIHKIAETLLASSDVQLVSCGSGDQALALVDQGDRFDVALVDTSMAGMDGWTLLRRLRESEPTRRMPVAMMAGVLDVVDPDQVRRAPIQGFLKKPVELRDLADRVKRLMETPVPEPEPPAPEPPEAPAAGAATPPIALAMGRLEADPDLLELGAGDLAPDDFDTGDLGSGDLELGDLQLEPAAEAPEPQDQAAALESTPLELEELDLEVLRGLDGAAPAFPATDTPALRTVPAGLPEEAFPVPEFLLADTLPDLPGTDTGRVTAEALPDLGAPLGSGTGLAEPFPGQAGDDEPIDWTDDSDSLVGLAPLPAASAPAAPPEEFHDRITFSDLLETGSRPGQWPEAPPSVPTPAAVPGPTPAAAPGPTPGLAERDAALPEPLAALLANPVLLDRLAKAVVARLGDQALREIAWEVMPELAERIRRQDAP